VDTGTHSAGPDTEEANFDEDINPDHGEAFCKSALDNFSLEKIHIEVSMLCNSGCIFNTCVKIGLRLSATLIMLILLTFQADALFK
jgi:hypothetical protein